MDIDNLTQETAAPTETMSLSEGIASISTQMDDPSSKGQVTTPDPAPTPKTPEPTEDVEDDEADVDPYADPDEEAEDEGEPEDDEELPAEGDEDPATTTPDSAFVDDKRRVKMADGRVITVGALKGESLLKSRYDTLVSETVSLQEQTKADRQSAYEFASKVQEDRQYVAVLAQSMMPKEPPVEMNQPGHPSYNVPLYNTMMHNYRQQMALVARVTADYDATAKQLKQQEEQRALDDFAETRQKENKLLIERVPEFADPEVAKRFWAAAKKAGAYYGYSDQQLEALNNHIDIWVLSDAIKWRNHVKRRELAKAKGSNKPAARPPVRGGQRRSQAEALAEKQKAAFDQLNKSHSIADGIRAAALLPQDT